jgi:hypothetical protein
MLRVAHLAHLPALHEDDDVAVDDREEPVRDDQQRALREALAADGGVLTGMLKLKPLGEPQGRSLVRRS